MEYLKSDMMGSTLCFNKIKEKHGAYVILNNNEKVSFRKGRYFQPIAGWDTVNYELFKTKEDCIVHINANYNEEKDWNNFKDINECLENLDKQD